MNKSSDIKLTKRQQAEMHAAAGKLLEQRIKLGGQIAVIENLQDARKKQHECLRRFKHEQATSLEVLNGYYALLAMLDHSLPGISEQANRTASVLQDTERLLNNI